MIWPALLALALVADNNQPTIDLWPAGTPEPKVVVEMPERTEKGKDGIARHYNITAPRLVVFEPTGGKRSDAAAIVIPGGGFGVLADEHEGSDACRWLNTLGITSFLLQHRCPTNKHPQPNAAPAQDAQRAMQIVRARAAEWKLDPRKIGVLGFSAGGQVAVVAATNEAKFAGVDAPADAHKPSFLVLLYPWMLYDPAAQGLRADIKLDAGLPPTFIAQCHDDKSSLPQGSLLLALGLTTRKIPCELHIYETGGHGFGMRPRPNATGPTDWPQRAADWLRLRGLSAAEAAKP